jgi:FkbM family methyltransferase
MPLPEVDTRYGHLRVPDTEVDLIGRFLARYGEWAWDEVGFVASVLSDGARVLDIGAFIGTFGLGLALRRRLEYLCFVEGNPIIAPTLRENVRRNIAVPSTIVVEAAGPGTIHRVGFGNADNYGATSFALGAAAAHYLPCTPGPVATLAELRTEHGEFDLIKLDVEGMELEILRSDAERLSRGDTAIWVECNEDPQSLAISELLLSWGLELHYFAFPHNPDNLRGDHVAILPLAYEAGLLAAPKILPVLGDELRAHRCILRTIRSVGDLKKALWHTPRWGLPEWIG